MSRGCKAMAGNIRRSCKFVEFAGSLVARAKCKSLYDQKGRDYTQAPFRVPSTLEGPNTEWTQFTYDSLL